MEGPLNRVPFAPVPEPDAPWMDEYLEKSEGIDEDEYHFWATLASGEIGYDATLEAHREPWEYGLDKLMARLGLESQG